MGRWLNGIFRGLNDARRGLLRSPGFTLTAVLTLALGIGANTAIFSALEVEVLRPLPYRDPGRLMALLETSRQFPQMSLSFPDYLDWRAQNRSFTALAAVRATDMILVHLGEPTMMIGRRVTANYFSLLGVRPELGRTFTPAEDSAGAPDVVVIAAGFWRDRLGADPNCLGRTLDLDGRARTIVGVMPPGFPGFGEGAQAVQFWTPLGAYAAQDPSMMQRGNRSGLLGIGRLKPGVTAAQAAADMRAVTERLAAEHPATDAGVSATVHSYQSLVVGDARPAMWALFGAVCLVLLIACANVANLLLARAAARQNADAIRAVLGASRARLIGAQMAESFWLALAGSVAGLLLAQGMTQALSNLLGAMQRPGIGQLDAEVLAFTGLVALLTTLACGLAPALYLPARRLGERLRAGSRTVAGGPARLRQWLVGAEMALTLLLLLGAGLLLRSLAQLQRVPTGFNAHGVETMIAGLPDTKYPTPAQQQAFFRQAVERMQQIPGVSAAGGIYPLPLGGDNWEQSFLFPRRPRPQPGREPAAGIANVRGAYFRAMGIPLLRGRLFGDHDTARSAPVALVDDTLARRYFPGPDPVAAAIGQTLNVDGPTRTIVGVVAHVQGNSLAGPALPQIYMPQAQSATNIAALYFVLRARSGKAEALAAPAAARVHGLDADQPLTDVQSMDDRLADALAARRRALSWMLAFAGLALVLAAIGIYGVMSYAVTQRAREMGIRLALGAPRAGVMELALGHGLRIAGAGAAVGLLLEALFGRYLQSALYGVRWVDPLTLAAVTALLLAVAAAACALPALRAARMDPAAVLRAE